MTLKIALVQVSDRIATNVILPLAIGVLWTAAKHDQIAGQRWRLGSVIYEPLPIDDVAAELAIHDMVCFSTYIWNADYHIALATAIKQRNPDCFLVFGGPHFVETWPNFWAEHDKILDLVLLGEGEKSFVDLLSVYPDPDQMSKIPGAWSKKYKFGIADRIQLEHYVHSPYLEGFYDGIIESCRARSLNVQITIQTNRGCPYHCTFCEEGKEYKNKIYQYNLDKILQEIEWCGRNQIEFVNIADDNFGILDRDVIIMEKICATSQRYGYPKIIDATYAKNNPRNVLAIAGLDKKYGTNLIRGITVALQSQNIQTLHEIKRFNLPEKKQNTLLIELKKLGVPTYAELIWPLPFETYKSLCSGIDLAIGQGLDNWIGMYPLSIVPSADLYHDFRQHYKFSDSTSADNNTRFHFNRNVPIQSDWVDHDRVVRGHVFYLWLTTLYFFGFARPAIDYFTHRESVSLVVNDIMDYLDLQPDHHPVKIQHRKLNQFWSTWLISGVSPDLGQFPGQDMEFWYPYTHHASWLQINHDTWLDCLAGWLDKRSCLDRDLVLDLCRHSVVKFGQQYPLRHREYNIELSHDQPDFANLHEFCRYYYWYNRKRGYSRTMIT
jgi:hypothetical protein